MMHARELKGGEAWSKEHVVSVEVSVRGEHSALLGAASHPGTAVPLAGTAWEQISPGWEQGQGAENGQRAGTGTALARRKRQGEQGKGQPGWWLGEQSRAAGAGALWAEEFSSRQAQGEQPARGKHREE